MDEDGCSGLADNNIIVVKRSSVGAYRRIDILSGSKDIQACFSTLSKTAYDVLNIQASSVAVQTCFSDAKNLITDHQKSLSSEIICDCLLL